MRLKATPGGAPTEEDLSWTGDTWDITQAVEYVASRAGCCVMIIDEYLVDVTLYLGEHVRPHEPLVWPLIRDSATAGWSQNTEKVCAGCTARCGPVGLVGV
jgi:hypothetical protein